LQSNWRAEVWSLIGAAAGYCPLWGVVELGKKAFGKKRLVFDPPQSFAWTRRGEDADLKLGDETTAWSEFFSRESDLMSGQYVEAAVDGEKFEECVLEFHYNRLTIGERSWELIKIDSISGQVRAIT